MSPPKKTRRLAGNKVRRRQQKGTSVELVSKPAPENWRLDPAQEGALIDTTKKDPVSNPRESSSKKEISWLKRQWNKMIKQS